MIEQTKHPAKKSDAVAELTGLTKSEWEELSLRLLLFTERMLREHIPPSERIGLNAQDFVQEAIMAYLDGERIKPKDIDLFFFLAMVIRSKISHLLAKEKRWSDEHPLVRTSKSFETDAIGEPMDDPYLREQILKLFADDEVLSKITTLMLEDPQLQPRDLAVTLGVPIRAIYDAKRRLKHKLSEFKKRESNPTRQSP